MTENGKSGGRLSLKTLIDIPKVKERLETLDRERSFHTFKNEPVKHTVRVVQSVTELGKKMKLSVQEQAEVRVAALFHDAGYVEGAEGHEERGSLLAGEALGSIGVDIAVTQRVQSEIMATKGEHENHRYVTNPVNLSEEIICDADKSHFGLPVEKFASADEAMRIELGVEDRHKWASDQYEFVMNVEWFTKAAEELYEPGRKENEKFCLKRLEKFEKTET